MTKRLFTVTIWNEEFEREYTFMSESHKTARQEIIKEEMERGTPFYKIHIESVVLTK